MERDHASIVAPLMIEDADKNAGLLSCPADLNLLSTHEFVVRWCMLVGEPPAVMLEDRAEMVRLLVESTPVASAKNTTA